jgi:hypothetical protein
MERIRAIATVRVTLDTETAGLGTNSMPRARPNAEYFNPKKKTIQDAKSLSCFELRPLREAHPQVQGLRKELLAKGFSVSEMLFPNTCRKGNAGSKDRMVIHC